MSKKKKNNNNKSWKLPNAFTNPQFLIHVKSIWIVTALRSCLRSLGHRSCTSRGQLVLSFLTTFLRVNSSCGLVHRSQPEGEDWRVHFLGWTSRSFVTPVYLPARRSHGLKYNNCSETWQGKFIITAAVTTNITVITAAARDNNYSLQYSSLSLACSLDRRKAVCRRSTATKMTLNLHNDKSF